MSLLFILFTTDIIFIRMELASQCTVSKVKVYNQKRKRDFSWVSPFSMVNLSSNRTSLCSNLIHLVLFFEQVERLLYVIVYDSKIVIISY
jgi:hypothetical protein